ncbi:MAG: class I poly(R)-hydroxyalkanoic acid synthase, partial [Burkholderiales bacterium]
QLIGGDIRFVLAASGHIAGVINPAKRNRRNFWINDALPPEAETWLAGAASMPGSWWPDWTAWLAACGGVQVPARAPGSAAHPPIEAAPGRYVREKCT